MTSKSNTKQKKTGCLSIMLIGFSALAIICLAATGLLAWDNARLPEHSEVTDRLSDREKALILETQHLRQSVGNEVLPGWDQADIPIILYNESYAFIVGTSSPPPDGWVTARKRERLGTTWEAVPGDDFQGKLYYRQALSPGVTPEAFTVKIGDTYAASLTTFEYYPILMRKLIREDVPDFLEAVFPYRLMTGLLIDSSDQYISAILHEAAHAYQGISAPERLVAGEQANTDFEQKYPWDNDSLREDWQKELDLLAKALRAQTDEETRLLAQEFLRIRHSRRQSAGLSADLIGFERHREWVEGIARYAEITVYRLGQQRSDYAPVDEILRDPQFHQYEKFDHRWTREIDQMRRMASDGDESRFYYTGMAQTVLLDRLAPDWKSRLFEPDVWLEDLLAEALSLPAD